MLALTQIPFEIDAESLRAQARVEAGSDDAADLQALVALAARIGRPKAAYAESFVVSRDGDRVQIDQVTFTSRALAHHLASVERVFPVVSTCGHEMDEHFPAAGDMLKAFWWDLIKARLLGAASTYLGEHLRRQFRLGKTAAMHPGAGDATVWPLEQQAGLFALLDGVESRLGIRLTDSFLMVPNKTTSGIVFPSERDFRSCQVCHREKCSGRQAPFDRKLWEAIREPGRPVTA